MVQYFTKKKEMPSRNTLVSRLYFHHSLSYLYMMLLHWKVSYCGRAGPGERGGQWSVCVVQGPELPSLGSVVSVCGAVTGPP